MPSKTIAQSLNKAYRRIPVVRDKIDAFKRELSNYFAQRSSNPDAEEEVVRQDIIDLLNRTFYARKNRVSPFKRKDVVVHLGETASAQVGVIIEVKRPSNIQEMVSREDLNRKAMHELLLYYLDERIAKGNNRLKNLIITDGNEFFIFDAALFERLFHDNRALISSFNEFSRGQLTDTRTSAFYRDIASPVIASAVDQLDYIWFDIRSFERYAADDTRDSSKIDDLYRVFSPEHLLKASFQTDSNKLDTKFYNELLYIIGLEEVKVGKSGNKRIIQRLPEARRNYGSLVELTLSAIESQGCLANLRKVSSYGDTENERLYNVTLTLVISWLNRILFLKLLESQLQAYHPGSREYDFMTKDNLPDYAALNQLFFQVLAVETDNRTEAMKTKFPRVPYLNSSLFEVSNLERQTLNISGLVNEDIPLYSSSVLKKRGGPSSLHSLDYLLDFLSSYSFTDDGSQNKSKGKTLINASVLGLVFEKINGHKDGAVYTPGAITMYMARNSIRHTVVNKFNEKMGWDCKDFEELQGKEFGNLPEANAVVDSITICDPSVGSGHFLVSALNEIVSTKYDLGILCDTEGRRIKKTEYSVEIINDELVVSEGDGTPFLYRPGNIECQRIQKMLFREKRKIIEGCLFGVDINPNAANICRLRLWIELLKNAYYTEESEYKELETLPNIDINIKVGNALVHRFPVSTDLSAVLRRSDVSVADYKATIAKYKNEHSKQEKARLQGVIDGMKQKLNSFILLFDEDVKKLQKEQRFLSKYTDPEFEGFNPDGFATIQIQRSRKTIERLQAVVNEKKKFSEMSNAFEWRLEFPEILAEDGAFVGFDLAIANPPYISAPDQVKIPSLYAQRKHLTADKTEFSTLTQKWDLYVPFVEYGIKHLVKDGGSVAMIVPYPVATQTYTEKLRKTIIKDYSLREFTDLQKNRVFKEVTVQNCILFIDKKRPEGDIVITEFNEDKSIETVREKTYASFMKTVKPYVWEPGEDVEENRNDGQSYEGFPLLGDICYLSVGLVPNADEKTAKGEFKKDDLISDIEDGIHCRRYIEAKDIEKYLFVRHKYFEWGTDRCPGKLRRKTFSELYDRSKLIINRLGKMQAQMDQNEHYLHNDSLIAALPWAELHGVSNKSIDGGIKKYTDKTRGELEEISAHYNLAFLLGILNTTFANNLLAGIRGKDYHIYPEHLRRLPIPPAAPEQQEPIILLVNEVLSLKRENPTADTSALEEEINRLVEALYNQE